MSSRLRKAVFTAWIPSQRRLRVSEFNWPVTEGDGGIEIARLENDGDGDAEGATAPSLEELARDDVRVETDDEARPLPLARPARIVGVFRALAVARVDGSGDLSCACSCTSVWRLLLC
jgi:hypothetical protein